MVTPLFIYKTYIFLGEVPILLQEYFSLCCKTSLFSFIFKTLAVSMKMMDRPYSIPVRVVSIMLYVCFLRIRIFVSGHAWCVFFKSLIECVLSHVFDNSNSVADSSTAILNCPTLSNINTTSNTFFAAF